MDNEYSLEPHDGGNGHIGVVQTSLKFQPAKYWIIFYFGEVGF